MPRRTRRSSAPRRRSWPDGDRGVAHRRRRWSPAIARAALGRSGPRGSRRTAAPRAHGRSPTTSPRSTASRAPISSTSSPCQPRQPEHRRHQRRHRKLDQQRPPGRGAAEPELERDLAAEREDDRLQPVRDRRQQLLDRGHPLRRPPAAPPARGARARPLHVQVPRRHRERRRGAPAGPRNGDEPADVQAAVPVPRQSTAQPLDIARAVRPRGAGTVVAPAAGPNARLRSRRSSPRLRSGTAPERQALVDQITARGLFSEKLERPRTAPSCSSSIRSRRSKANRPGGDSLGELPGGVSTSRTSVQFPRALHSRR